MSLAAWLEQSGAAKDVVDWARPYGGDGARAWRECPRGDWLLAIAARAGVEPRAIATAAAACARLALDYVSSFEKRPLATIEVTERWARGEATDAECAEAARAAEEASNDAPDPVGAAAALAAYAAARAASVPEEAATAASAAAEAAALASAECGAMSAFRFTTSEAAENVRGAIPWEVIAPRIVG